MTKPAKFSVPLRTSSLSNELKNYQHWCFATYEQTKGTRQSYDLKVRLYLLFQALQSVCLGQNAKINTFCLVLSLLTLIPQKTAPCV